MTGLPPIPANFSVSTPPTPAQLEQAEEQLRKIEEIIAKLESYSNRLQNLNVSVGGKIKDGVIKSTVDPLLDFGCNFELRTLELNLLINLYSLAINIPTLPTIPNSIKLLLGINVNIVPDIPTVAEFKQYVNKKIEEAKKKCQEQAIAKQIAEAQLEETPFTARQETQNNRTIRLTPDPACVTTETGITQEEALSKAEFKLKRIQKCCECCGNTPLQILNSKQENGVFIVTAGILKS